MQRPRRGSSAESWPCWLWGALATRIIGRASTACGSAFTRSRDLEAGSVWALARRAAEIAEHHVRRAGVVLRGQRASGPDFRGSRAHEVHDRALREGLAVLRNFVFFGQRRNPFVSIFASLHERAEDVALDLGGVIVVVEVVRGAGLGEVADAAVLCPSFYKADIVQNATWWDRLVWRIRSAVIAKMAHG